MNTISYIMVAFALIGALDRIFGNKLGLGKEFEKGIYMLGPLAISMVGMLIMSPFLAHYMSPLLEKLPNFIDPSIITASIFANDQGGGSLSHQLANNETLGYYNGLVVASMMGCTISFTVPFAMSVVKKEQHHDTLLGLLCGVVTIPIGCIVSGFLVGLSFKELIINLVPLIIFSALIALGLLKIPNICVKIFSVLGYIMKAIITVGLAVGILTFLTGVKPLPYVDSIENAMSIVLNAACVMTGALPLLYILEKIFKKPLDKIGERLGINQPSVKGLVATLATSAETFEEMKNMNRKGVVINSAFAVSAAFAFTDHIAFTMAFNGDYLLSVVVGKLISAVCAVFVAMFINKKMIKEEETD